MIIMFLKILIFCRSRQAPRRVARDGAGGKDRRVCMTCSIPRQPRPVLPVYMHASYRQCSHVHGPWSCYSSLTKPLCVFLTCYVVVIIHSTPAVGLGVPVARHILHPHVYACGTSAWAASVRLGPQSGPSGRTDSQLVCNGGQESDMQAPVYRTVHVSSVSLCTVTVPG